MQARGERVRYLPWKLKDCIFLDWESVCAKVQGGGKQQLLRPATMGMVKVVLISQWCSMSGTPSHVRGTCFLPLSLSESQQRPGTVNGNTLHPFQGKVIWFTRLKYLLLLPGPASIKGDLGSCSISGDHYYSVSCLV